MLPSRMFLSQYNVKKMSIRKYEIGTASVKSGSKGYGHIEVARTQGQCIIIPLIVLCGAEDGPTLVVEAAMHGGEITGSIAVNMLTETLDPKKMKGTFIGIPVVNVPAFEARMRWNPWDKTDLAMTLPNPKREGTVSERTGYLIVNEIIPRADYFIDMHTGPAPGYLLGNLPPAPGEYIIQLGLGQADFSYQQPEIDPEVIRKSKEMLLAWGTTENIWWRMMWGFTLPHNIAATKGIPAICSECGVEDNIKGLTNMMKYIGMLEGKPEPQVKTAILYEASAIWNWDYTGLWVPKVNYRDQVVKGDILGEVLHPYTGKKIGCITASTDGVILAELNPASVKPGGWLGAVGPILEKVEL